MKTRIAIALIATLAATLTLELRAEEPTAEPSYVERVQRSVETMEVFPIDFIAIESPLSYIVKGSNPKIGVRLEFTRESFERFYRFCQLAFDAAPEDIEACVDYLPRASAKERAAILTIFYMYAYPWEARNSSTDLNGVKAVDRTQS